ncbi:WbqC family protein [Candidatus Neomarinimicrobiota bacterium]
MSKKVAILQSNYIPWKGYFDLINSVDEFILYDDVQYTKKDWRNRNLIKTQQGIKWITIPVLHKYTNQLIKDTKIADNRWTNKHWAILSQNYSKAHHFKEYKDIFEELYLNCTDEYLSQINYKFIVAINKILDIDTKISWSSEFNLVDGKTEKLISICKDCNAQNYLSGPTAKDYFDERLAEKANIKVEWMDYSDYPEYKQLHPPFDHRVSIIDLIFNEGSNSKYFTNMFKK